MQTIVAGLMALVAMGASILADVDPVTVVVRGGIAFGVGLVLAGVWTAVVNPAAPKEKPAKEPKKKQKSEVESDEKVKPEEDMEEAA
jgi:hypothetical protein